MNGNIPKKIMEWIDRNTEPNSKVREDIIKLVSDILGGKRINWNDVRNKSINYIVLKMRWEDILLIVKDSKGSHFVVNPELLKD